jgi:hypothetical protein
MELIRLMHNTRGKVGRNSFQNRETQIYRDEFPEYLVFMLHLYMSLVSGSSNTYFTIQ